MEIKQVLNQYYLYRLLAYWVQKISININPRLEIERNYVAQFGKKPNLRHPKNLIEKIYWMSLHCDLSEWTLCADKFRMRQIVEKKGCGKYLPKLYGVWDNPKDIDWDNLPHQFVIKANNGCGTVLIVKDKEQLDLKATSKKIRQWLAIPYGYRGFQPHYLGIKPCILAEEMLQQNKELDIISPNSMVDFKVWAFNGHVESCFVAYNRQKGNLNVDLYDSNWNRLLESVKSHGIDRVSPDISFPKPKCWNEMKTIASQISKGMPQVRVDFYIVNDQPVIGELTMATGYGYFTEEYYNHLGDLTDVTLIKKIK